MKRDPFLARLPTPIRIGLAAVGLFAVAWALASSPAHADRSDVWSAASVNVYKVELDKLSDGGCAVTAYASYSKQDGGVVMEGSRRVEVAGVNRTDCLAIVNTRAPVLFRADKDL